MPLTVLGCLGRMGPAGPYGPAGVAGVAGRGGKDRLANARFISGVVTPEMTRAFLSAGDVTRILPSQGPGAAVTVIEMCWAVFA